MSLSDHENRNFRLMLDFIRDSPEFQPLSLSVILPEFRSSLADFLLKYATENTIEAYTARTRDLSLRGNWRNRSRLTWTFFVRDVYSLNIFIYWRQQLWRPGDQYLIIIVSKTATTPWGGIFKSLWRKYRVYRAVIVSLQDDFRCLSRYMPFDTRRSDFGVVQKLCLHSTVAGGQESQRSSYGGGTSRGSNAFEDNDEVLPLDRTTRLFESFQNINGYPVNVVVFESLLMDISYDNRKNLKLAKMDAEVVSALEKAMGAKLRVKAMRKLDFYRKDPFDLSLKDIESGKAEMVVTGFFMKIYEKHQKFQFTCAVYEDKLCFISPDTGLVPRAYMPFLPFEKELWFLLIAYDVLITALWCFMKHADQSLRYQSTDRLTMYIKSHQGGRKRRGAIPKRSSFTHDGIFSSQLRRRSRKPNSRLIVRSTSPNSRMEPPEVPQSLSRFFHFLEMLCYPLNTDGTPAQKVLVIAALFFMLIVNGLYQSYLVCSLSKPFHYPQLQTMEEVLDSGRTLITKYANLKSVFLGDSPLDRQLNQRIRVINSSISTKDLVAFGGKVAISRYYTVLLSTHGYYDQNGNALLHVVEECPMKYRVSYVLRSHSPYAERVDFILLRLREAGLFTFWFRNMTYPLQIARARRKLEREKRTIKLTLYHYSLTFLLLLVGLLGSALAFLAEIYAAGRKRSGGALPIRTVSSGDGFESTQPAPRAVKDIPSAAERNLPSKQ